MSDWGSALADQLELIERRRSFRELWKMYRRLPRLAAMQGLRNLDLFSVKREIRRQLGVMRRLRQNPFAKWERQQMRQERRAS